MDRVWNIQVLPRRILVKIANNRASNCVDPVAVGLLGIRSIHASELWCAPLLEALEALRVRVPLCFKNFVWLIRICIILFHISHGISLSKILI